MGFYFYSLQNKIKTELDKGPITIGLVPFPGYSAFYIARDKGFFKEEGLDIEIRTFNTLAQQAADYANGEVQMVASNVADAVNVIFGGVNFKIVSVVDYSSGVDAISRL
ncbi:MAG: ABC transporter substrate-binding protein [Candidatus Nomurabacteria bacterium]|nr:ABC transporter substrate-binding protein [Candidatus Nomurabacteria bacterium]